MKKIAPLRRFTDRRFDEKGLLLHGDWQGLKFKALDDLPGPRGIATFEQQHTIGHKSAAELAMRIFKPTFTELPGL